MELSRPSRAERGVARVGAGVNLTPTWEKSGSLDSSDIATTIGPLIAVGAEFPVSPNALVEATIRWNAATVEIEEFRTPAPSIDLDPLALGLGLGFRF